MNVQQAAALLGVAASFDNRKPDPDAATAWSIALDGYRFEDCRDAIVNHYRQTTEWLMPKHVIEGAKKIRWDRLVAFNNILTLEPPRHLADDPRAEIEWRRRIDQRVMDGEITHPEQVDAEGELKPHDVIGELGQVGRTVPARD